MSTEISKLILQLLILGVVGGAVTFYYNRLQRTREIFFSTLSQLSSIYTDFKALRYKFNVLFTDEGKPIRSVLKNEEEVNKLKWKYYEEACLLLSKFESLKPLLNKQLPHLRQAIDELDTYYHEYRRTIRANEPILQDVNGNSQEGYKKLKQAHKTIITGLTDKV